MFNNLFFLGKIRHIGFDEHTKKVNFVLINTNLFIIISFHTNILLLSSLKFLILFLIISNLSMSILAILIIPTFYFFNLTANFSMVQSGDPDS